MNLYINEADQRLVSSIPTLEKTRDAIGIYFSLSKLDHATSGEHLSIVINVLRDQFKSSIGDIYAFKNKDILIVYRGRNEKLIQDCLYQVQYLFSDDNAQLTLAEDFLDRHSQVFYPKDWAKFLNTCQNLISAYAANQNSKNFKGSIVSLFSSTIEDLLAPVEWDVLMKSKPIFKHLPEKETNKVFDEIYADVKGIAYVIGENFDISNNVYLNAYFKEFLDLKLLVKLVALLSKKRGTTPYMLNLNITTVASQEFWTLAESLPDSIKQRIVLAISITDVFRDLGYFLELREKLSGHGFKLCLDDLDYLSFMQIDRSSLGFDLIRIKHKPLLGAIYASDLNNELSAKIAVSGSSRVILEVENKNAVNDAQKLGALLYQISK
ncbi:MAG: hypothetical protein K0R73_1279 [Candidatus Midichloriaceae bacterium]|jgi:hypothetical protein|nr:hypothetical protein [Candidatus Midichloriaceae bacterium]